MKVSTRFLVLVSFIMAANACKEKPKSFFHFDQVLHYQIDIEMSRIHDLLDLDQRVGENQALYDALFTARPFDLGDSLFLGKLESCGYRKYDISAVYFSELNEIFSLKHHKDHFATACEPIFRDVLVFKKSGTITGISSICFECGVSDISGTQLPTNDFGQSGDYQKLFRLLEGNKNQRQQSASKLPQ